jgi:uncharacterized protein
LSFILKRNLYPNVAQRIRYVTKLYNEEVHILAGKDVRRLFDLYGKKVNVDVAGCGTAITASTLFDALGLKVETTNFDQALAVEKVKNGEIAATVFVDGKPTDLFRKIEAGANLHQSRREWQPEDPNEGPEVAAQARLWHNRLQRAPTRGTWTRRS